MRTAQAAQRGQRLHGLAGGAWYVGLRLAQVVQRHGRALCASACNWMGSGVPVVGAMGAALRLAR